MPLDHFGNPIQSLDRAVQLAETTANVIEANPGINRRAVLLGSLGLLAAGCGAGSSLEGSLSNVQDPELKRFLNAVIDYSVAERNKDKAGEKKALDFIGNFLIKNFGRTPQAAREFDNFVHILDDQYSPFHEYLMPRGYIM